MIYVKLTLLIIQVSLFAVVASCAFKKFGLNERSFNGFVVWGSIPIAILMCVIVALPVE